MIKMGQTERIVCAVTPAQKDEIGAASRRASMTSSEYIRSRVISHRASFPIPGENNEFYLENSQYCIVDTRTENIAHAISDEMKAKFRAHDLEGYHADCVICQSKDPRTEAERQRDEDARDYAETVNSVRPGGM